MLVDVAAFVGAYPYRHLRHATPEWLIAQMDRLGIDRAWVGDAGAFLLRDPAEANATLYERVAALERLAPVPTVALAQAGWERDMDAAVARGAPAVRVYPQYEGLTAMSPEVAAGVAAAATRRLPLIVTVRFEDPRQRHRLDTVGEPDGALLRAMARADAHARILVSHAPRELVEEVHFGLTPDEARRVVWDVAWVWGPPEDHLALLWETVGEERFVLGTGMPLRVPDATLAKLELLAPGWAAVRARLSANLQRWLGAR